MSRHALFDFLIARIRSRRPWVAEALLPHRADLLLVADPNAPDRLRVDALRRTGQATIAWALDERVPSNSSIEAQRLRADLRLLHQAWALAHDLRQPEWYRELARATAHGIGLVIASGLSGEEAPGGLDLHIWRACGTRSFVDRCDDTLCRICWEHDQARAAIRAEESRQNWEGVLAVAGATLLTVGIAGALAAAFGRR